MGTLTRLSTQHPTPEGYYTAPDVCTAAGITYRQLDFWIRGGLIHADNTDAPGQGYRRLFTSEELDVACHLADLTRAGMLPRHAAPIARQLARGQPTRLGPYQLTNPTPPEDQQP